MQATRGADGRLGRWIAAGALVLFTLGCAGGVDEASLVGPAEALLQGGDLPGAYSEFDTLKQANADSVRVAIGRAYTQKLAGQLDEADSTLQSVEAVAGDQLGAIKLRRALLALDKHNFDEAKRLGNESGTPEGKLIAAEVNLVDLDSEQARALLRELQSTPGVVGATASTYITMLEGHPTMQGLAEATALWALGERSEACDVVEGLMKEMPGDTPDKDAMLLLWAGRAVTSQQVPVARSLLDEISFPPAGQEWRLRATQAMVLIAEGDAPAGMEIFDSLRAGVADGSVPGDGLNDALATACGLAKDAQTAQKLVEGVESPAAARCLLAAGADGAAASAPAGPLKTFLENK